MSAGQTFDKLLDSQHPSCRKEKLTSCYHISENDSLPLLRLKRSGVINLPHSWLISLRSSAIFGSQDWTLFLEVWVLAAAVARSTLALGPCVVPS